MKNPELKQQFLEDWIPMVEKMLKEEQEHLANLEKSYKKLGNVSLYGYNRDLLSAISYSKLMIDHFEERLQEYITYAQNL